MARTCEKGPGNALLVAIFGLSPPRFLNLVSQVRFLPGALMPESQQSREDLAGVFTWARRVLVSVVKALPEALGRAGVGLLEGAGGRHELRSA